MDERLGLLMPSAQRRHLLGMTGTEISAAIAEAGEPRFRADQIRDWVFDKRVASFDDMRNIPKTLWATLSERFVLRRLAPERRETASDGLTEKVLFRTDDGHGVEAVLIREGDRRTACVSCSVGCPLDCAFCASAKGPFVRRLDIGEMVEQVVALEETGEERIGNVVFMGTGEPFLTYDAVLAAARRMNAPDGLGIGARRITVSTAGVVEGIRRFASEPEDFRLAVSLHAPSQEIRERLMPSAKRWPMSAILDAAREYCEATGRDITMEYILIDGENATETHAAALVKALRGVRAKINLIPCNPVDERPWRPPPERACRAFRAVLEKSGLRATLRLEKGRDISAACGQLRARTDLDDDGGKPPSSSKG